MFTKTGNSRQGGFFTTNCTKKTIKYKLIDCVNFYDNSFIG